MKVGFYLKEVNFRGIANSIYTFAKNNEKILKNKSVIFYNSKSVENQIEAIRLFKKKFTVYKTHNFNELEKYYKKFNLDYVIEIANPNQIQNCLNYLVEKSLKTLRFFR